MMNKIKQQIKQKYSQLSNRLQIVATFIAENPKLIALYPAKEIGNLTDTSETTVIRCSHALGYAGYAALQEDIRKSLLLPDDNPLKALTEGINTQDSVFTEVLEQDLEHIRKTYSELNQKLYEQATTSIAKAKKVLVIGLRTTYAPAYWLAYTLNIIKGNTILYRGDIDDANYIMTEMGEDWFVIAFSFQRYTQHTISFVQAAKGKGAKVLSITDNELSPVGLVSDFTFKVSTPMPSSLKGMPTIFSLLNLLVQGVMARDNERVEKRIGQYNQSSEHFFPFYTTKTTQEETNENRKN